MIKSKEVSAMKDQFEVMKTESFQLRNVEG